MSEKILYQILEKLKRMKEVPEDVIEEIEKDLKEGRLEEARDTTIDVLERIIADIEEKLFREEAKFARAVNEWALQENSPEVKEAVKEYNQNIRKTMEEFHKEMSVLVEKLYSLRGE